MAETTSTESSGDPDFLCIGMQKAGTGWLYDQLQFHPGFWMPPAKELHYFDRDFPDKDLARTIALANESPEKLVRKRAKGKLRALDERDHAFFVEAQAAAGTARDLDRYAALFRFKGGLKSGDVTPAYSSLDEQTVGAIARRFPRVQVILLLRDPVERVWSQACMAHRRGKFPLELLDDLDGFRRWVARADVQERAFATRIHARWRRHVGDRLRCFFFDDIETQPAGIRSEILSFLGADPDRASGALEPAWNRKAEQPKLEMPARIGQVLAGLFADELRACAETFQGHAIDWVARHGANRVARPAVSRVASAPPALRSTAQKTTLIVAGCPRSGTTVLTRLLNLHPDIVVGIERYKGIYSKTHVVTSEMFEEERFFRFAADETNFQPATDPAAAEFYQRARAKFATAKFVGDKYPQFYRFYDALFQGLPDAKVVFIVRDLVRVAQSWQRRSEDSTSWPAKNDARRSVEYWNDALAYTLAYSRARKDAFVFVDYEQIFTRKEEALFELFGWIGAALTPDVEAQVSAAAAGEYRKSVAVLGRDLTLDPGVVAHIERQADRMLYRCALDVIESQRAVGTAQVQR